MTAKWWAKFGALSGLGFAVLVDHDYMSLFVLQRFTVAALSFLGVAFIGTVAIAGLSRRLLAPWVGWFGLLVAIADLIVATVGMGVWHGAFVPEDGAVTYVVFV